ncbi:hypothetical protein DFH07DRAFT_807433 [Mycena maculata]|uniref:Uncharacterized protein n=1 Tax=Mycena maculata TaxID=230809 RepID=A0AAD7NPB5_9AGAR|nr:hypothetical protein DFH07DRAFT_807433 [Mycena maculata]
MLEVASITVTGIMFHAASSLVLHSEAVMGDVIGLLFGIFRLFSASFESSISRRRPLGSGEISFHAGTSLYSASFPYLHSWTLLFASHNAMLSVILDA